MAMALVGVGMFSSKSILIKLAYGHGVDAATLMTLRMLFSLPFYLVVGALALRSRGHSASLTRKTIAQTLAVGIMGYYVASFLDLSGLHYITAQLERLILFTYPAFVVLFGALFFKTPISKTIGLSLLLCSSGVVLIFAHDFHAFGPDVTTGALLVLGSSLAFAFYLLFAKSLIDGLGSQIFTSLAMIGASCAIVIHFTLTHDLPTLSGQPPLVYVYALFMAIFATVIPSFLVSEAVTRIGVARQSILGTLGPVFTSLAAIFILGERFTVTHLLGMSLVIAGIIALTLRKKHRKNGNWV